MKAELISIETETTPLDGLYYEPKPGSQIRGSVQLLHGNTMNFYIGHNRFMPPALVPLGYAVLAYNRRGHDILSIRDSREVEGAALQITEEAVADNNHARTWMLNRGLTAPICIGHSNGGMLAAKHVAGHPDTPALVLLSAHVGGSELVEIASANGLFGRDQLPDVLQEAERRMNDGRGDELMMLPGWYWVTTARSFLDYSANLPSLLEQAEDITCPVLFVRGDQEPAELYPAEEFRERCPGEVEFVELRDCGHFYDGLEEKVNEVVCDFLSGLHPD